MVLLQVNFWPAAKVCCTKVRSTTGLLPSSFNAVNQLVLPLAQGFEVNPCRLEAILRLASNNGRKLQAALSFSYRINPKAVHSIFNRFTSRVAHKVPGKKRIGTG